MKVRDSDVSARVRGQKKMSQVLGAFGLQDFTMLRPALAWRAFWILWTVYLFNFTIFFSGRGKPRILNQRIWRHDCLSFLQKYDIEMLFSNKDFLHLIFFYTHLGPIFIFIIIYHDFPNIVIMKFLWKNYYPTATNSRRNQHLYKLHCNPHISSKTNTNKDTYEK
jgi:hypothetical protein